MSIDAATIARAAEDLRQAEKSGQFIRPLRETYPGLDLDDAYRIQDYNTQLKLKQGARIVGAKIGLTSPAVQKQLGVDTPDYGVLLNEMGHGEGLPIPMHVLQQPKVEAEVAFVLGRDIEVANPSIIDVINAIEYALPALEIVGSRIADWNIKLVDTVADNASSNAWVVGGSPKKLNSLDLRSCMMTMDKDGEVVSTGLGSACLGHPLNATRWLAATMARVGAPLKAGYLVLSGALGPMANVQAGKTYTANIEGLGSVSATFDNV